MLAQAATPVFYVRVPISKNPNWPGSGSSGTTSTSSGSAQLVVYPALSQGTNFGVATVNSSSTGGLVNYIENTGTGTTSVTSVAVAGNPDFSLATSSDVLPKPAPPCESLPTLAPGDMCYFTVDWAPTATGAETATATVSAADGETVTLNYTGTGLAASNLSISSPGVLAFGQVPQGNTSTATVTLNYSGSTAITISSVTPPDSSYVVNTSSGYCAPGQSLSSGSSCSLQVSETPTSTGTLSGNVVVTASDGETISVPVSGSSVAPTTTGTASTSGGVTAYQSGVTNAYFEVTVVNTGNSNMTLPAAPSVSNPSATTLAYSGCGGATVYPGKSCTDIFEFSGTSSATATISYALVNGPTISTTETETYVAGAPTAGYALFANYDTSSQADLNYMGPSTFCPHEYLNLSKVTNLYNNPVVFPFLTGQYTNDVNNTPFVLSNGTNLYLAKTGTQFQGDGAYLQGQGYAQGYYCAPVPDISKLPPAGPPMSSYPPAALVSANIANYGGATATVIDFTSIGGGAYVIADAYSNGYFNSTGATFTDAAFYAGPYSGSLSFGNGGEYSFTCALGSVSCPGWGSNYNGTTSPDWSVSNNTWVQP